MAIEEITGTLYASKEMYDAWSGGLEKLGIYVLKMDPNPGEGVGDPTLHVGTHFHYGERSIARYMVHRANFLGLDPDTL